MHCGWALERREGIPIMLSKRDRSDSTFQAYLENYDDIARDDLTDSIQAPSYLDVQGRRLIEHTGSVDGLDVMDVGVGQGRTVRAAFARGAASVTGIDIATAYLRLLVDTPARLIVANAENLPFRNEFDVVIASEVLEHVLNPGDLLISAHEALRPGGRFIVRVPYREDLRSYAMLRNSRYRFVHLRAFTKDLLRLTLEQSGFRVKRMVVDGFDRTRTRDIFKRNPRVREALERQLEERFPRDHDVHRIDPRLGRILFEGYELTAIAYKKATQ
jgi:2-polyprenyl-3-methyl-5-hydroxy-6-metoxy-1,4-benzoquinol methylase